MISFASALLLSIASAFFTLTFTFRFFEASLALSTLARVASHGRVPTGDMEIWKAIESEGDEAETSLESPCALGEMAMPKTNTAMLILSQNDYKIIF